MPNSRSNSTPKQWPVVTDSESSEDSSSDEPEPPIMFPAPMENDFDSDAESDTWSMETSSQIDSVYHTDSQSEGEFGEHDADAARVEQQQLMLQPRIPLARVHLERINLARIPLNNPDVVTGAAGPIRNVAFRGRMNRHMPYRGHGRRGGSLTPFQRGETFNGFERRMQLDEIIGFTFEEENTNILYDVRWQNVGENRLIESSVLRMHSPDAIISYYENLMRMMFFDTSIHPRIISQRSRYLNPHME